jgi:hypothetical protein
VFSREFRILGVCLIREENRREVKAWRWDIYIRVPAISWFNLNCWLTKRKQPSLHLAEPPTTSWLSSFETRLITCNKDSIWCRALHWENVPLLLLRPHASQTKLSSSLLGPTVELMLPTGQKIRFCSGSGSNPEVDRCNEVYQMKTWTVAIGPVFPPKARNFMITSLAPIKYLSSDRVATWSVYRLCIIRSSFISRSQNCDATDIHGVALEIQGISCQICSYFTATARILVISQFWMRKVKDCLIIHILCPDHVTILSELRYIISVKELPLW